MGHKDYKTINVWLKDLREKEYVTRIYSTDFLEKTKPAIYYLSLNGIRFLKANTNYPIGELRKRYREPSRSKTFIDRCILVAECCTTLHKESTDQLRYSFATEADYLDPESGYNFLAESELTRPSLCIEVLGEDATYYLLEIFDATLPRYRLRKRLKNYVEYLKDDEWQNETDMEEPPIILLALPTLADLIYAKRCTKKLLNDAYYEEVPDNIHIRFTTTEKLTQRSVTSPIWEEKRSLYDLRH
jgi:hypothetical protein